MILYHYNIQSYHGDESLLNDYDHHGDECKPFVEALRVGVQAYLDLFEKCEKHYETTGEDLYGYDFKGAVEGAFEYIRLTEFPDHSVSRVGCVYYCRTQQEAIDLVKANVLAEGIHSAEECTILEVEVEDGTVYEYDQHWYDKAWDLLDEKLDAENLKQVFSWACRYFQGVLSENPDKELLSAGKNRVLRVVEI